MARSSGLPDVQTHLVASYHIMVVYDYDDDVQVHQKSLKWLLKIPHKWTPERSKAKGEDISHDVLHIARVPEQR